MSAEAPKGSAWCGLHDIYYREASGGCWYCLGEERPGQFVTLDPYAAHHRGAFRALAEIGLAIVCGELLCAALMVSARLPHPDDLSFSQGKALRRLNRARVSVLP